MDAATFLSQLSTEALRELALDVGTSVGVLRNIKGGKQMGPELAARFEAATAKFGENQTVYRWVSMPARWHLIWPELIHHPLAPKVPASDHLPEAEGQVA